MAGWRLPNLALVCTVRQAVISMQRIEMLEWPRPHRQTPLKPVARIVTYYTKNMLPLMPLHHGINIGSRGPDGRHTYQLV